MKLRYTKTAFRQIGQALAYIENQSPQGSLRVATRLECVLSLVIEHPHAGQTTDDKGVRRLVLTPYPYTIFYRATGTEIVVLRFRHASRKPR